MGLQKDIFRRLFAVPKQKNQFKILKIIVMKPLLLVLTLLAVAFTQPTFATERDVTPSVLKSFQSTFNTAKDVEWIVSDNLFKARFELNCQVVMAYYSTDGALLAITRNITSHQLPLALQTSLKKGHEGHWISELFEMNNTEGTSYFVTLENAEGKVVLKSSAGNGWNVFSKSKKD